MEIVVRHAPSFAVARAILAGGEAIKAESGAMMATSDGDRARGEDDGRADEVAEAQRARRRVALHDHLHRAGDGRLGRRRRAPARRRRRARRAARSRPLHRRAARGCARSEAVDLDTKWGGFKNLFGGEGGFLVRATGQGHVVLSCYGALDTVAPRAGRAAACSTPATWWPTTRASPSRCAAPPQGRTLQTHEERRGLGLRVHRPGRRDDADPQPRRAHRLADDRAAVLAGLTRRPVRPACPQRNAARARGPASASAGRRPGSPSGRGPASSISLATTPQLDGGHALPAHGAEHREALHRLDVGPGGAADRGARADGERRAPRAAQRGRARAGQRRARPAPQAREGGHEVAVERGRAEDGRADRDAARPPRAGQAGVDDGRRPVLGEHARGGDRGLHRADADRGAVRGPAQLRGVAATTRITSRPGPAADRAGSPRCRARAPQSARGPGRRPAARWPRRWRGAARSRCAAPRPGAG